MFNFKQYKNTNVADLFIMRKIFNLLGGVPRILSKWEKMSNRQVQKEGNALDYCMTRCNALCQLAPWRLQLCSFL